MFTCKQAFNAGKRGLATLDGGRSELMASLISSVGPVHCQQNELRNENILESQCWQLFVFCFVYLFIYPIVRPVKQPDSGLVRDKNVCFYTTCNMQARQPVTAARPQIFQCVFASKRFLAQVYHQVPNTVGVFQTCIGHCFINYVRTGTNLERFLVAPFFHCCTLFMNNKKRFFLLF